MKTIFLIAGEASGDLFASKIINELKKKDPNIRFIGIGGPEMIKAGMIEVIQANLAVMGIFEVLPKLFYFLKLIRLTIQIIIQEKVDLLLTLDSGGFNFEVGKRLHKQLCKRGLKPIPHFHFVAPAVWAWRPQFPKKIAPFIKHLFCLFPFEPPLFEKYKMKADFVGHPLALSEGVIPLLSREELCHRLNLDGDRPVVLVLFGSREAEIKALLAPFTQAMLKLRDTTKTKPQFVVITFEKFKKQINEQLDALGLKATLLIDNPAFKEAAFIHADVALAASGTVVLELALRKTPTVVGYKMNPFTYHLIKRIILINTVSLPNILLKEKIVPEFIQNDCTPENLSQSLSSLLGLKQQEEWQRKCEDLNKMIQSPSSSAENIVANRIIEELFPK